MSASFRKLSVAFVLLTLATASTAAAQVPRRPLRVPGGSTEPSGHVTLALAVGAQRYAETKPGQCKHAPKASIYDTPAMMWTVQYSPSSNSSIALVLWRPTGTATVTFVPRGAGGRFEINGTTADGVAIRGTIDCERITALTAEGGD